jgi:hypothetical protein
MHLQGRLYGQRPAPAPELPHAHALPTGMRCGSLGPHHVVYHIRLPFVTPNPLQIAAEARGHRSSAAQRSRFIGQQYGETRAVFVTNTVFFQ